MRADGGWMEDGLMRFMMIHLAVRVLGLIVGKVKRPVVREKVGGVRLYVSTSMGQGRLLPFQGEKEKTILVIVSK